MSEKDSGDGATWEKKKRRPRQRCINRDMRAIDSIGTTDEEDRGRDVSTGT